MNYRLGRTVAIAALGVTIFLAGLLVGRSSAQGVSTDSTWWQSVEDSARPDVVHGGLDAYEIGWQRGSDAEGIRIDAAMQAAADAKLVADSVVRYVHATIYKKNAAGHYVAYERSPTFSKTFGAYGALIDDFYVRHPSAANSVFGDILTCLADDPAFSCDQIAKFAKGQ